MPHSSFLSSNIGKEKKKNPYAKTSQVEVDIHSGAKEAWFEVCLK